MKPTRAQRAAPNTASEAQTPQVDAIGARWIDEPIVGPIADLFWLARSLERQLASERARADAAETALSRMKELYEVTLSNEQDWMRKWQVAHDLDIGWKAAADEARFSLQGALSELAEATLDRDKAQSGFIAMLNELDAAKELINTYRKIDAEIDNYFHGGGEVQSIITAMEECRRARSALAAAEKR